jgi:hypothetical protein
MHGFRLGPKSKNARRLNASRGGRVVAALGVAMLGTASCAGTSLSAGSSDNRPGVSSWGAIHRFGHPSHPATSTTLTSRAIVFPITPGATATSGAVAGDVCVKFETIEQKLAAGMPPADVATAASELLSEVHRAQAASSRWDVLASDLVRWRSDFATPAALSSEYADVMAQCHTVPAKNLINAEKVNNPTG